MTESQKYWRDKAVQLLVWGTVVLFTIAGWSINDTEKFEIGLWAGKQDDQGNVIRGVALLVFSLGFSAAWYRSICWIYRARLSRDVDDTVIPWPAVRTYTLAVIAVLLAVACLVALG